MSTRPRVLTIAGSDPTGGAGIQADLETFAALGARGFSVVTAVTVQDTSGVAFVQPIDPEVVGRQMRTLIEDVGCDAIKIGMVGTSDCAQAVATVVAELAADVPLVLDPVLASSDGQRLLADEPNALQALRWRASVVTPNWPEAAALLGQPVGTDSEADAAALELLQRGAGAVLLTRRTRWRGYRGGPFRRRRPAFAAEGRPCAGRPVSRYRLRCVLGSCRRTREGAAAR